MENSFPPRPRRCCRNSTGPGDVSFTASAVMQSSGDRITSASTERIVSIARFPNFRYIGMSSSLFSTASSYVHRIMIFPLIFPTWNTALILDCITFSNFLQGFFWNCTEVENESGARQEHDRSGAALKICAAAQTMKRTRNP